MKCLLVICFSCVAVTYLHSQTPSTDFSHTRWKASWIDIPGQPPTDYGVYRFRKKWTLETVPASFTVLVSADNRFKLYVNGAWAGAGPSRGDLSHWNYETFDLAPYLRTGENQIEAVVWNFGADRPEAQISYRTAFILQGTTPAAEAVNTDRSWSCMRDKRYEALKPELIYTYYVAGPGEKIDYSAGPAPADWKPARELWRGVAKGVFDWSAGWMLVPVSIPPAEMKPERMKSVRKSEGVIPDKSFPSTSGKLAIPAGKKAVLWIDNGVLTNAYAVVKFNHGKDAVIRISYAEALYEIESGDDWRAQRKKGHRNVIEGKRFVGVTDQLIADGRSNMFTSLWWRTYRYVQLEVETKGEALEIEDIYGIFTGYPFKLHAAFSSSQPVLSQIFDTGWRTARLCAVETYMDCPYYEQLQYVGDTRIQALVSLFNSGDDRLMRQAIDQLDDSRMAEGITLSRYPSFTPQQIPTFSLWWIGMIHDFRTYRNDEEYVRGKLPGIRQVLNFFSAHQQNDGSLKNTPYWLFSDWAEGRGWDRGVGPVGADGSSALLDLQLCWAFRLAATMERDLGMKAYADQYDEQARQLKTTINTRYWNASKGMFSDTGDHTFYSQHTNTLAILAGVTEGADARDLMSKILNDTSLTQATIYFKYYVHSALSLTGLGDQYIDLLQDWKDQLANGLTTWAEISDHTNARSDCHAWGASPNIALLRTVLGVDSDTVGFQRVKIAPSLGRLTSASGKIPHPAGEIAVQYSRGKGKWTATIDLPVSLSGKFVWREKQFPLKGGRNFFDKLE